MVQVEVLPRRNVLVADQIPYPNLTRNPFAYNGMVSYLKNIY